MNNRDLLAQFVSKLCVNELSNFYILAIVTKNKNLKNYYIFFFVVIFRTEHGAKRRQMAKTPVHNARLPRTSKSIKIIEKWMKIVGMIEIRSDIRWSSFGEG